MGNNVLADIALYRKDRPTSPSFARLVFNIGNF